MVSPVNSQFCLCKNFLIFITGLISCFGSFKEELEKREYIICFLQFNITTSWKCIYDHFVLAYADRVFFEWVQHLWWVDFICGFYISGVCRVQQLWWANLVEMIFFRTDKWANKREKSNCLLQCLLQCAVYCYLTFYTISCKRYFVLKGL